MKRLFLILILISLSAYGCGLYRLEKWSPKVGITESELIEHWGKSHDCSTYSSRYGSSRRCWYTVEPFTGMILGSYFPGTGGPVLHVLVTIEDDTVTDISTHH